MKTPLHIAIAGCGPAGLAAALFLFRSGHRVTLFDRFAAPQPLGSGLIIQPTGLSVLSELGLGPRIVGLGQRIDRLFGRAAPSGRIVLDVRYAHWNARTFGLAVHRSALFGVLYEAVLREGIALETGRRITGLDASSDGRAMLLREGAPAEGPFDLVVDALGVRSPLGDGLEAGRPRGELAYGALWGTVPWPENGFDPNALEQRYRQARSMVGLLPIGFRLEGGPSLAAFFWSIKPSEHEIWRQEGLPAWKKQVLCLWPELEPVLEHIREPDSLTLARYSHHTRRRIVSEGLAAIGDAAHAASPQLGQGANMALLDARALAVALDSAADVPEALEIYAGLRHWHVRLYQALSFTFTPLYQSDSRILPWLRDRVLAPVTRWPGARRLVTASVAGTLLDPRTRLHLSHEDQEGPYADLLAGA